MSAGPTPSQVRYRKNKSIGDFMAELADAFPLTDIKRMPKSGERVAMLSSGVDGYGFIITVGFRMIYASNGEACGWPVVTIQKNGDTKSGGLYNAPWMAGGASVEKAIDYIRGYVSA